MIFNTHNFDNNFEDKIMRCSLDKKMDI